jgi:hypothetical protein
MAFILHTGEYLEIHGADATEHTMKTWGKGIKERAQELVEGFKLIGTPEVLNRFEIVNQCEDAVQLKIAVLSLADTEGMIKGRRRPFKAARMAGFVEGVIAGELPPECLTREFGIRQQALYIKYYEDNAKENKS